MSKKKVIDVRNFRVPCMILALCFGEHITLFHCSITLQVSQDNITSEKTLKRFRRFVCAQSSPRSRTSVPRRPPTVEVIHV
jgi:hypothetical protein